MEYTYFPTQTLMYEHLKSLHPEFDMLTSLAMSRHSFCDVQGKQYNAYTLLDFIDAYNMRFGNTFIREKCQVAGRNSYLMYFFDRVEKKDTVQEQKEIGQVEELSEEKVKAAEVAEESVKVDLSTLPEVDWEWVDSLSNSKYSKAELENYAIPYGINLKKTMSIDNMRKAFREHMGVAVE